jgi:hypothetical protein
MDEWISPIQQDELKANLSRKREIKFNYWREEILQILSTHYRRKIYQNEMMPLIN